MMHSHLPGLPVSLTLPASDDPGLNEGLGTCGKKCWVGPRVGREGELSCGCEGTRERTRTEGMGSGLRC